MTPEDPMDGTLRQQLERLVSAENPTVSAEELVDVYRREDPTRPVLRLIEDIQWQAMAYTNLIEQLKSAATDEDGTSIRNRFVELGLLPSDVPNPLRSTLIDKARSMLSKYRKHLIDILRDHGQTLRRELNFGIEVTATAQVHLGIPPFVSLGIEYAAALDQ